MFVDVTYVKARVNHQVVPREVVIATGVTADGNPEVLGVDVGKRFWPVIRPRVWLDGLGF